MSTQFASKARVQAITPNHAAEVINVKSVWDQSKVDGAALAVDDYINFVKIPAGCIVVDLTVAVTAAVAALVGDVGLNDTQNVGGANDEFITGLAGGTVGVSWADEPGMLDAVNDTDEDMYVALKVSTIPSGTTGRIAVSVSYRSVLSDNE